MSPKKDILYLKSRRKIYNLILNHPGLHLRELVRKLDLPFSTIKYHIDYLERKNLVSIKKINGFSRHYITEKVGKMDKKLLNAFRQDSLNKILVVFLFRPSKNYFYKKDFKRLPKDENWCKSDNYCVDKHRTTLRFHLNKLVEMGIVEIVQVKGRTCYRLVNSSMIWDFLIRYQNALSNGRIDCLLRYCSGDGISITTDRILEKVHEIFPHPYYG